MVIRLIFFVFSIASLFSCKDADLQPIEPEISMISGDSCYAWIDEEFQFVEMDKIPSYIEGGHDSFYHVFLKNATYPAFARENSIQGLVVSHYQISAKGKLDSIQTIQEPHEVLGKAVNEVLSTFKEGIQFNSGIYEGDSVRTKKIFMVKFKLQ